MCTISESYRTWEDLENPGYQVFHSVIEYKVNLALATLKFVDLRKKMAPNYQAKLIVVIYFDYKFLPKVQEIQKYKIHIFFFKILEKFASAFFLPRQIVKIPISPRQKPRQFPSTEANFNGLII